MFFPTISTPQGPPQVRRQGLQERVRGNSSSLLVFCQPQVPRLRVSTAQALAPEPGPWVCWQQAGHSTPACTVYLCLAPFAPAIP